MTEAPKRIWAWITGIQPLQGNAGLWRSDEGTLTDDEYILFTEHERLMAEKDAEIARLREALKWYGEQARLCRLIHGEGDAGRHALNADGGKRARAALGDDNG